MNQIQKVSSYLLITFNVLLVALPLCDIIQWFFIDTGTIKNLLAQGIVGKSVQTPEGYVNLSTVQWTPFSKTLGFSADILGLLPFVLILFGLKSIFRNYQKGEIFSTANARYYKYLGWIFFFDALLIRSLSNTLMVLAVTLSNPPGHRYINIQFGTPNMKSLFYGIIVIVISKIMLEASKLHDDQRFTI
jgi:hypothetical protein